MVRCRATEWGTGWGSRSISVGDYDGYGKRWESKAWNNEGHHSESWQSPYNDDWSNKRSDSKGWGSSCSSGSGNRGRCLQKEQQDGSSSWAGKRDNKDLPANATFLESTSTTGEHRKSILSSEKQGVQGCRAQSQGSVEGIWTCYASWD